MILTRGAAKSHRREIARRRRQLLRMVGENAVVIVPAAPPSVRSRDTEYRYRQNSDFLYLTGFTEPDGVLFLRPRQPADKNTARDVRSGSLLFCRPRDAKRERYDGPRLGPEQAPEVLGMDAAWPLEELDQRAPELLAGCEKIYYPVGSCDRFDDQVLGWVKDLRRQRHGAQRAPETLVDVDHLLHDMRLFKSRTEVARMRRAGKLAAQAVDRAMRLCQPGMHEYEVEAELIYELRRHNSEFAYLPIVASGENACTLHYVDNQSVINDGDLLLIDAGAEVDGYASDITRTFPVNGCFSSSQRDVYEVVLEAQLEAIAAVKPGNHWNDPHEAAVKAVTRGLREIGLLKGRLRKLIKDEAYKKYFPHRTGHWIGLDVHDVGDYQVDDIWRQLEPGMAMTIEPGIYISSDSDVPKSFRGMGIRIEDDVVVTKGGCEVLTDDVVKDVAGIEGVVGKGLG